MEKRVQFQWEMKPQECEGDYFFNGISLVTNNVAEGLSGTEIGRIVVQIWDYVKKHNGADYLFIFTHPDGRKIYVIDQLSKSMMESGNYTSEQIQEYNYFTMMYNWEY